MHHRIINLLSPNALIQPGFEKSCFLECKSAESSAMQGPRNDDKTILWDPVGPPNTPYSAKMLH